MKPHKSITWKITGIITIILLLVSIVGLLTYQRFSNVLDVVTEAAKPDVKTVLAKEILYDLTKAENSVKTYTLTHDTLMLDNYHELDLEVDSMVSELKLLVKNENKTDQIVDSLKFYVDLKFDILDELLAIQNEFRVEKALTKVSEKVSENFDQLNGEQGRRLRIIKWNPLRRKSKDDHEAIESITNDLRKITAEETSKEAELIEHELNLILSDKVATKKIQTLVSNLELYGSKKVIEKAMEVRKAVNYTNIQIIVFCIVISALLIVMSYTIVRFVRNTHRYRKALKKSKKEALDLAKVKEHFVATVSHEIRTPMNIISGYTDQLSKENLTQKQREQIEIIQKASEHLLNLINDVLDFTKLENNKLTLLREGFRPQDIINEVVSFLSPMCDNKAVDISASSDSEVPEILIGDSFRLRQILINIIGNAVKFTDKGGIEIKSSSILTDHEQTRLRIRISDTGIGMNPDKIDRIFNEFEQAQASTSQVYGGTGLGLAITKKLIELHHGTIEVDSEENKGTQVTIEIPYDIGTKEDLPKNQLINHESIDLSKKRILIVDDEKFNRQLLISILEKYNATFTEAKNGKEAIDEALKNDYDLILMDARMPEVDGVTAAAKIVSHHGELGVEVPIIALTAAVTEEDRRKYKKAGMIDFLAKPFKEVELINIIKKTLFSNGTVDSENHKPPKKEDSDGSVDFSQLKEISNDDPQFYYDLLKIFVDSTKLGVLDLEQGIKEQDFQIIAETAHKISSPCKHLAADNLYENLKKIESIARSSKKLPILEVLINEVKVESEKIIMLVQEELKNQTNG